MAHVQKKIIITLLLFLLPITNNAYVDGPHYWRATPFFGNQPYIELPGLTTINSSVGYGSTAKSRNKNNSTTPLFNLYGNQNFHYLGNGVPNKNPNDPLDGLLINLAQLPSNGTFGEVAFDGDFSLIESYIQYTQNIMGGFFMDFQLPIRQMNISNITYEDLSPTGATFPSKSTPEWQSFLENLDAILVRYKQSLKNNTQTNVGDTSILVGWACNQEETTDALDFIDATFKSGILFPTGRQLNPELPFDIASGYNGHWGVPLQLDVAFGFYEWLNIGFHTDALFFFNRTQTIRMKTDISQNGFIKLSQGNANVSRGILWTTAAFMKADHAIRGLSAVIAYSFAQQNKSFLTPCNNTIFNTEIVNTDNLLDGFKMHVIHFSADYDFTDYDQSCGAQIGFYYDLQVGGRYVFKNNMVGGTFGINVAWQM